MRPQPRVSPVEDPTLDPYRTPDGAPIEIFWALAHSAPALDDLKGATARSLRATELPVRPREILILRVLAVLGASAETATHVQLFGATAQLSDEDLIAIAEGTDRFSGLDSLMLRLGSALAAGGTLDDDLWEELAAVRGISGAVEALFIGAQYAKVAILNNALGLNHNTHQR